MTAHDRALELGAARVDFRLSAGERDALDGHLAVCARCRSDMDGMADDVRRLESRPAHRIPPDAAAAIRARLERPKRAMSPGMVFVAAVLLVLLAIAVAAVGSEIQRRLDESRLAVEPVPSVVPSPGPSEAPSEAIAWSVTEAGRTTDPPLAIVAVDASTNRWIAVGQKSCVKTGDGMYDCAVAIARSADGRAWSVSGTLPLATRYVPVTSGPEPGIVDVAAGPEGFVAVGFARDGAANPVMGIGDGAAWWSADGLAWERTLLEDGARPSTVFRAPDRWLIGGVVYRGVDLRTDRPIGAIWASTDGRTWTRIENETVFDVGGYFDTMEDPGAGGINAFAWNGSLLVAGGAVYAEGGLPSTAAVWLSGDGATWERAGALPAALWVDGLAAVGGGFVAATTRCPGSGDCVTIVLHSADGRTWVAVPGELPPFAAMTAGSDVVVLVTGRSRSLDVRASTDGKTWPLLGAVAAPERINWGAPVLVPRPGAGIDLLIRFDPVNEPDTEADAWNARWEIVPLH